MSRIKSAWEIALEKTKDLEIDQEKFKASQTEKNGQILGGRYLTTMEMTLEELASQYSSYGEADKELVKKGMGKVIFANLSLPSDDLYTMRFDRTKDLVCIMCNNNLNVMNLMEQIGSFFDQFIQAKSSYVERMQEQIRQAMEENPEQTNPAQYTQLIQQNLKKMELQYSQALEDTKESLKQLLGL
ncbi:MAG: hypothetical protein HUK24_00655 [Sphaerochaetaceae bacterium]|nr:hypothetical protein [Sphaerochaetaceae bacterium]